MIEKQPMISSRNEHHWGSVLGTVSLDLAQAHLEKMGLFGMHERFIVNLRQLIKSYRSMEPFGMPVEPQFPMDVLELAEYLSGSDWARYLRDWGNEVFQSGFEGSDFFVWSLLLDPLAKVSPTKASPLFIMRVMEILRKDNRAESRIAPPRSEWDLEVYRRAEYDAFRNAGEFIVATMRTYSFWSAWESVPTPRPDADVLLEWGRARAKQLFIPVEMVGVPSWGTLPMPNRRYL